MSVCLIYTGEVFIDVSELSVCMCADEYHLRTSKNSRTCST